MFSSIREFLERGQKGYCYKDLWSFDSFLSDLLVRGLTELKQNCHSYPNDIDDWDEWMLILDEMIECFKEQERRIETNISGDIVGVWKKRREHQKKKLHRGLELLERYYYDLWD